MEDQDRQSLAPPLPIKSTSPFLSLPPELKQAIFSALPDANTLTSLVLTCSNFYHTFRNAESLIIKSILHNQIGSHLLFDALIVLESGMLTPHNDKTVCQLLNKYAKRAPTITSNHQEWKLRHAVAVSSLHETIECLSNNFACLALGTNVMTGLDEPSPTPLSAQESNRIKRAFYRYELFCTLFPVFRTRGKHGPNLRSSKTLQRFFFRIREPWENEQLRCVRDYLFDRLCIRMCPWRLCDQVKQLTRLAYNDVAEHDVEWGNLEIRCFNDWYLYDEVPIYRWTEFYLLLGLSRLHQLFNTSTFDERCQLFKSRKGCPGNSISAGLGDMRRIQEKQESGKNQTDLTVDPLFTESAMGNDRGPEKAWRWGTIANGLFRAAGPQRTLRRRGYVMWDFARLAAWDLLDHDWHRIPCEEPIGPSRRSKPTVDRFNSWTARRKIWERGGRGWWSPGDESRVVWPPGGPIRARSRKLSRLGSSNCLLM